MLVSAIIVARAGSAEAALDPGRDKTPGLVAVMGLEPANKSGLTQGGRVAEAVLLYGHAPSAVSSTKTKVRGQLNTDP